MENYILDKDNNPQPTTFALWAAWLKESPERKILCRNRLWIDNTEVFISTVFLGLDHSFGTGKPILFETMIFGGKNDGWQDRYHTYREACEGHNRILLQVMNNEEPTYS